MSRELKSGLKSDFLTHLRISQKILTFLELTQVLFLLELTQVESKFNLTLTSSSVPSLPILTSASKMRTNW